MEVREGMVNSLSLCDSPAGRASEQNRCCQEVGVDTLLYRPLEKASGLWWSLRLWRRDCGREAGPYLEKDSQAEATVVPRPWGQEWVLQEVLSVAGAPESHAREVRIWFAEWITERLTTREKMHLSFPESVPDWKLTLHRKLWFHSWAEWCGKDFKTGAELPNALSISRGVRKNPLFPKPNTCLLLKRDCHLHLHYSHLCAGVRNNVIGFPRGHLNAAQPSGQILAPTHLMQCLSITSGG